MASVHSKKTGAKSTRWYIVFDLPEINPKTGKPKQKWLPIPQAKNKTEAKKALIEWLKENDPQTYSQPSQRDFQDYLDDWVENHIKLHREPRTYLSYKTAIDKFKEYATKPIKMERLENRHLQDFINFMMKQGLAASSVNIYSTVIKTAINHAYETGQLSKIRSGNSPRRRYQSSHPKTSRPKHWRRSSTSWSPAHTTNMRFCSRS